jgi:FkbH-like protein
MVQHDTLRKASATQAASLEDFLTSLDMTAEVGLADANTLERIHQLVQKTNQFNLTTRRHNTGDLRRFVDSPDAAVAWLRLADRYGDLGLVCVGIIHRLDGRVDGPTWVIDTLLMSCRVMGRQVEHAFLSYLAELARDCGAKRLRGVYLPTAKNTPVRDFFQQHGFTSVGGSESEGERQFELSLSAGELAWPAAIRRADVKQKETSSG